MIRCCTAGSSNNVNLIHALVTYLYHNLIHSDRPTFTPCFSIHGREGGKLSLLDILSSRCSLDLLLQPFLAPEMHRGAP